MIKGTPMEGKKMSGVIARTFDAPDETRTPDKTKVEVIDLDGSKAARLTMEPGWRWSECIKPVVGTDSCQARHLGIVRTGRMHVVQEGGTGEEMRRGDPNLPAP